MNTFCPATESRDVFCARRGKDDDMTNNVMTPNALAEKLAGSANRERVGKTFVRPLLRRHFPRDVKGTSWYLNDTQIALVTAAWKAKQAGKPFDANAFMKARRARKAKAVTPES